MISSKPILLFFLFCTLALLLISCDYNNDVINNATENPFMDFYDLGSLEESQELVIVSDVHLGREEYDDGVFRYDDEFEAFLTKNETKDETETKTKTSFAALISLGDMLDESSKEKEFAYNFIEKFAKHCSNKFISIIGNHETHVYSVAQWESTFTGQILGVDSYAKAMAVYKFDDVSIYVLNNSKRMFGYTQLDYLEQALKKDKNSIKIVLAHENIMTGGKLDQSLIAFGNNSIPEIMRFSKIMEDNSVCLVLTGHTHNGQALYKYKNKCHEMNLAAYHARITNGPINFEGQGNWYTLSIDRNSKEVVVKTYFAKTGEFVTENRFSY